MKIYEQADVCSIQFIMVLTEALFSLEIVF